LFLKDRYSELKLTAYADRLFLGKNVLLKRPHPVPIGKTKDVKDPTMQPEHL